LGAGRQQSSDWRTIWRAHRRGRPAVAALYSIDCLVVKPLPESASKSGDPLDELVIEWAV